MATTRTVTKRVVVPADTSSDEYELLRRAAVGDEGTRNDLRALLARRREFAAALWDSAREVEGALIRQAGGRDVLVQESMRADLEAFRASLREPQDGALEELLISDVALCWFNLMCAERRRADAWSEETPSHASGDFWDRHVSRLRVDYLRAVRALGAIRRICAPAIQLNIANQQVNQVRG